MAAIVNDRDVLIVNAGVRDTAPRAGKYIILTATPNIFPVNSENVSSVASATLSVQLVGLTTAATWSAGSGYTLAGSGDNIRTLAFTDMTEDYIEATATVIEDGQTYTSKVGITKVKDGQAGETQVGPAGTQHAVSYLYKWSTLGEMDAPSGTATFTWAKSANTGYNGVDSWTTTPQANPGTVGAKLWVAAKPISAVGGEATTSVTFGVGATVSAFSENGAQGPAGVKSAVVRAYQWSTSGAPTVTGAGTWTYALNDYDNLPITGWTKTKGSGYLGATLYEASLSVVDASGAATTNFNWTDAAVVGIGYIGTNGSPGVTGDAATIAYTLVDGFTLAASPTTAPPVAGKNKPSTPVWGETRPWTDQPQVPAAGQSVFQSNGIYNSVANQTIWGVPYLSNLKVGNLSAISANLGTITAGSMNINNKFTVNTTGDVTMSSATITGGNLNVGNGKFVVDTAGNVEMRSVAIKSPDGGVTILASGVPLNSDYAAAGTRNADLAEVIADAATTANWSEVSGTGKPADNASADITLIGRGVAVNGNRLTKTDPTQDWNADAYSKESAPHAFASATVTDVSSHVIFGLNDDPAYSVNWNEITFSIFLSSDGTVYTGVNAELTPEGVGFTVGDVFVVSYDGVTTRWYKNGNQIREGRYDLPGVALYFDSSFYIPGGTLGNCRFGPLTSSLWSNIGGNGRPADNATVGAPAGTYVGSNLAQDLETLAGAQAKATAARIAAEGAAATYAQAQAGQAAINAAAYADGKVSAEEARAIQDATNKAEAARVAAVDAAASDATAKANLAATTANWVGVSGVGRPADNATVGATIGANLGGAFNAGNVPSYFVAGAITDTQIGGNLKSSNWNGSTGTGGTGWLLERATGNLYCNSVQLRGAISGGAITGWGWPAAGSGNGFYVGPNGILLGNQNDGKWMLLNSNGDMTAPGLTITSGLATYSGALSAAYGSFGALRIAAGGHIASGAYGSLYEWPGIGAGGGAFINESGLLLGNANNSAMGFFQVEALTGSVRAPGFELVNRQLTLTNSVIVTPTINNPKLTTPFNVYVTEIDVRYANEFTYADGVASVGINSGGNAGYDYMWAFSSTGPGLSLVSSPSADHAVVRSIAGAGWRYGTLTVTVKNRETQATSTASAPVTFQMGSGAEP